MAHAHWSADLARSELVLLTLEPIPRSTVARTLIFG